MRTSGCAAATSTVRSDWRASRSLRDRVPGAGTLHHAHTAKGILAVVGFPKGSAPELLAAVHDDVLAECGCRLLVLDGRIGVGLDQRVNPQRQPELIATASDRTPDAFFDRGEPVANGSLVDLEQRAGRGRILTQAEIGPQRRTQPGGLGVRGRQRSKLACNELTRAALILDDQRLERDVVVPLARGG
jgi:hypothetical protein